MSNTPPERQSIPDPSFNLPDSNPTVDSALRLIASPLIPVARAAVAQHPFPVEELHDDIDFCFNSDIPSADFDDFLLDTQYVQLNPPQESPHAPTATIPQPPQSPPPPPPPSMTKTSPPPPPPPPPPLKQEDITPRRRPSPKRTRPSSSNPSPIPIAPRTKQQQQKHQKNPQPQQPQQLPSKQKSQQFESRGAAPLAERRNSTDASPAQSAPMGPTTIPFPPHMAQGMIPLMNVSSMYPLHHHAPIFPVTRKDDATSAPGNSDNKKMRVEPSTTMPVPQFLSPSVPLVPPSVFQYDPGMVPFFQMTPQQMYAQFAAAYQGHPPHAVPSVPQNQPNIQGGVMHPFPVVPPVSEANKTTTSAMGADGGGTDVNTQAVHAAAVPLSPAASLVLQPNRSMVGGEIGSEIPVPQQSLARLEKHPVIGRLQLQSDADRVIVKAAERGKSSVRVTDTQAVDGSSNDGLGGSVKIKKPAAAGGGARAGSSSQGGNSGFQEGEQSRTQKKRLVWTPELHERFLKAIDAVGLIQAVPKTLVSIMNVEGLTTEHVKSHLQKYRNSLRKEAVEEQRERNRSAGMGGPNESGGLEHISGADANRNVSKVGVMTNENGERQFPVLPNRISVYGTPVGTEAGAENGRVAENASSEAAAKGLNVSGGNVNVSSAARSGQKDLGSERQSDIEIQMSDGTGTKGEFNGDGNEGGDMGGGSMHPGMAAQLVSGGVAGVEPMNVGMIEGMSDMGEMVASVGEGMGDMGSMPNSGDGGRTGDRVEDIGEESQWMAGGGGGGKDGREDADDVVTAAEIGSVRCGDNEAGASMDGRGEGESSKSVQEGRRGRRVDKETRLELMNATTLQMQLTLQIMVHRTIALERRLEQESTDKMQAEASVTVSGRSGRSDRGGSRDNRSGSRGNREEVEEFSNGGRGMVGAREGRDGEMSSKSTVAALLKGQIEMTRALEQTRAMISEEMKDHTMEVENERIRGGGGE